MNTRTISIVWARARPVSPWADTPSKTKETEQSTPTITALNLSLHVSSARSKSPSLKPNFTATHVGRWTAPRAREPVQPGKPLKSLSPRGSILPLKRLRVRKTNTPAASNIQVLSLKKAAPESANQTKQRPPESRKLSLRTRRLPLLMTTLESPTCLRVWAPRNPFKLQLLNSSLTSWDSLLTKMTRAVISVRVMRKSLAMVK